MLTNIGANAPTSSLAEVNSTSQLLELWLHGKSAQSQRAYQCDFAAFSAFTEGKLLTQVTLNDVQAFATALLKQGYSSSTQNRRLSAIKSLLSFGHRVGYLPMDVGAPVEAPKIKNTLAERILTQLEVITAIALEPNQRNKLLLQFMYLSGARVSEVTGLRWHDLKSTGEGRGQVALFGKGGKTRFVVLPNSLLKQMLILRGDRPSDAPVFVSRKKGGAIQANQVRRIVEAAGRRAGIDGNVSPHWLRHSHASHALDRGAPVQLVQATLGHSSVATTSKYLHARPSDSSALYLPM
jgi:integrase/recombinase XerD